MLNHRLASALAALLLAACSAGGPPGDGGHGIDASDVRNGGDVPHVDVPDPSLRYIMAVNVLPPDMLLAVTQGTHPTLSYSVVGQRRDGTMTGPLTGVWSLSAQTVGNIDSASGVFTANGAQGGGVRVHVDVATPQGMLSAETGLDVVLNATVAVMPITDASAAAMHFTGAGMTDAARAVRVVYPLANTVMPQNVFPADIQWVNGTGSGFGNAGDIYRVTLHKTHIAVVAYVQHTGAAFKNDWLVDTVAWRALAQTAVDEPMTITVDRWDSMANQVVTGSPVTMQFANGSVIGSVYYWDIAAGRSIRIDDGMNTRVQYMPNPPVATDGSHCVGCHSISQDGRWFIGRLGGGNNIGAVFDLTLDLTGNPPPTVFPTSASPPSTMWWFASFNPDATRMIAEENLGIELINPRTGAVLVGPGSGNLPASSTTHPAWSPDGHNIVVAANTNDWGGQFSRADLGIIPVTGADTFGPMSVIHRASSLPSPDPGTGNADSYPTWSPDSHWIAFAHGSGCRSESHQDALYIMASDGSAVVRLDNASGGPSAWNSYQPHFSPFDVGGYFWVSFLSRRDYGNPWAGTAGSTRQQIWVSAIQHHPSGSDPSQVSYWLPGQDTASRNIAAYWAPRPCRHDGSACDVGSECCSGICGSGDGGMVCTPPPMDQCRHMGQPCGGSGCCPGLVCIANVCSVPPG